MNALSVLACPSCRGALDFRTGLQPGAGVLSCPRCRIRVPSIHGFPLFTEREMDDGSPADEFLERTSRRLFGDGDFAAFCEQKRARGIVDAYAAWAPFNESGRTFLSFVPLLREILRPGDVILDLANRTGWTGEFLAGLFPGQRVLSAWEGNTDCLGYRGFREWLPKERRAPNLEIVFFDAAEPLPVSAGAVKAVHGYDVLHHGRLEVLLPEVMRAVAPGGALIFPHVHLKPEADEPGFHRPGELRDAATYRRVFDRLVAGTGFRACVLGEATMFAAQKAGTAPKLEEHAESPDYNGVVAVVPSSWIGRPLAVPDPPVDLASASVLVNPLFRVAPHDGSVSVAPVEGLKELPGRHPVYARLVPAAVEAPLGARARVLHYWADKLTSLGDIAKRLGEPVSALAEDLAEMERRELVRAVPLSRGGHGLQRFQAALEDSPPCDEDDLPGVWRRAVARYAGRAFLIDDADGGCLTYRDADKMVSVLTHRLRAAGVKPGNRLALCAPLHMEGVLLFWAAVHAGAALAVVDVALPPSDAVERIRQVNPALLFTSDDFLASLAGGPPCSTVLLDPSGDSPPADPRVPRFSSWLRDEDYAAGPAEPAPCGARAPAAILFTSGSSGKARGVILAQQALAHSGRLMARQFEWRPDDVHLSAGDLHAMTSLRNPAIATVHAGAATVVAAAAVRSSPALLAECVARRRVTLLTGTPALLRQLTFWADRLPPGALASLRTVSSAGSVLTEGVRRQFEEAYRTRVCNFYGLTETTGLCIGETIGVPRAAPDDIGRPVDALVRVVDPEGRDVPPGGEGELLVHSANLFLGYLDDPEATRDAFVDGWFRTGDRASIGPDGSCRLRGRLRDAIKNVHTEFVSVREVQEALDALPDIADAGVGAYVDDHGQEHLGAIVVPKDPPGSPSEEAAWASRLRSRLLVRLGEKRMPSRIVVRDQVPRNSNGKFAGMNRKEWLSSRE